MRTTKFFDGSKVVPYYRGVYRLRDTFKQEAFSFWDGESWFFIAFSPEHAVEMYRERTKCVSQNCDWCGLSSPPDELLVLLLLASKDRK